jgi:hypothetical protein
MEQVQQCFVQARYLVQQAIMLLLELQILLLRIQKRVKSARLATFRPLVHFFVRHVQTLAVLAHFLDQLLAACVQLGNTRLDMQKDVLFVRLVRDS